MPDRKTLVTGTTRSVTLWDLATDKPRHALPGHQGDVDALLFCPGGKELLTGGYDRPVLRWNLAAGQEVGRVNSPNDWNRTLALSPDGKTLAALGPNLSVVLLDAVTGKERLRFVNHLPPGTASATTDMAVVFSRDGKTVISSTEGIDRTIRVWQADSGKELLQIPVEKGASRLALAPDGKTLYSSSWGSPVRVWDLSTGIELRQFGAPGNHFTRLALSADGRRVAYSVGPTVFVWDTATGKELCQFPGHKGHFAHLAFSPDGRTLATAGDEENRVRFWEIASARLRLECEGHGGSIKGMAFSPDGLLFATGSSDTTALVWDFRNLALVTEPVVAELTPKHLETLWLDLAGEPDVAFRAVSRLAQSPRQVVAFLGKRLGTVPSRDVSKLIAQLDDEEFDVREKASKELETLGREAEAGLRKAEKDSPSAEVRSRARALLEKLAAGGAGASWRGLRALEVLEAINTAEARQVIVELARGAPEAELTAEARIVQERMKARP
jgi:hypothetical protein